MKTLRKVLFGCHLAFALAAGLVLATMGATGSLLAFREPILAAAEAPAGRVEVPQEPEAMPLGRMLRALRETHPDGPAQAITLFRDPSRAALVSFGRGDSGYFNPYTGDLVAAGHAPLRAFFESVEHVHRWLGLAGPWRERGKAVTHAGCAVYLFLLLSGLYLWWPRSGSLTALRRAATPSASLRGRARDWNWHTVAGFWASPILLLTTSTGLLMAYPRLADALPGPAPASVASGTAARPPGPDERLASVEAAYPHWDSITLRLGGGRPAAPREVPAVPGRRQEPAQPGPSLAQGRGRGAAFGWVVREDRGFPVLPQEVAFDPSTGRALPASASPARSAAERLRAAAKSVHTGEAFGRLGEALACLGGLVTLLLVCTGFALAWRRFRGRDAKGAHRPAVPGDGRRSLRRLPVSY